MLIGLHGAARSGKDSTYKFIKEWADEEGVPCRGEAFADRLKLSAARALGFDGDLEQCLDYMNRLKTSGSVITHVDLNRRKEVSGREYLQRYGTEAHREIFGDDFWISQVLKRYHPSLRQIWVVTDVRFPNEAEAIHFNQGEVWRIVREGAGIAESSHASEQPLDRQLIDYTVENNGTLDHLRDSVMSKLDLRMYAL